MNKQSKLQKIYRDLQSFKKELPLWERLKALKNYYASVVCHNLLLGRQKEAHEYVKYFDYVDKLYLKELIRETVKLIPGGER